MKLLTLLTLLIGSQAWALGSLQVNGTAGPTQHFSKVKVQRCDNPSDRVLKFKGKDVHVLKRNCENAIYLNLNTATPLKAGQYIVGFENSLYPGFIVVHENEKTQLDLIKINISDALKGAEVPADARLRVYRDFSSLIEQKKIYFQYFYSGKHFFKLTNRYSFGDYYLMDSSRIDSVQFRNFDYCSSLAAVAEAREHVQYICAAFNSGRSMMDLSDLFRFETAAEYEGQFQELNVGAPGDVQPLRHAKHLVSAPLTVNDFVSVFPGVYRISLDGKTAFKSVRVDTAAQESYADKDLVLTETTDEEIEVKTCDSKTSMWKTEMRSYCSNDKVEGCDRNQAQVCHPIDLDLKFRRY